MKLHPSDSLTPEETQRGLKLVIKDGLAAEAMVALTGGTFLTAMALTLGASNFQIGLLASLPTITNIFQLLAIWLVQKYNNRRAITVICSMLARFPLFIIGVLPFVFSGGTSVSVLIFLLFFHYFFGSISGASWNSWMKDLVPENELGNYFSRRSRLTQILSVTLSLLLALGLDFIKSHYPGHEFMAYAGMFLVGGVVGMAGVYLLMLTPEPKAHLEKQNIFRMFHRPLKDKNFRSLLIFNSMWVFSLNLATPFFSVYLMKIVGLPLSWIIGLGVLQQLSSIFFVRIWGRYSDQYSNKNIIRICAPLYIVCILSWIFTKNAGIYALPLLAFIHIVSGVATSGIDLALNNIGMKLAPRGEAIVYLSAKNMVTAMVPAVAPILGGLMADFFAGRQLAGGFEWKTPAGSSMIHLFSLQRWDFFFAIGALLALLSLRKLRSVTEEGEVEKRVIMMQMVAGLRTRWRRNRNGLATIPAVLKEEQKRA